MNFPILPSTQHTLPLAFSSNMSIKCTILGIISSISTITLKLVFFVLTCWKLKMNQNIKPLRGIAYTVLTLLYFWPFSVILRNLQYQRSQRQFKWRFWPYLSILESERRDNRYFISTVSAVQPITVSVALTLKFKAFRLNWRLPPPELKWQMQVPCLNRHIFKDTI